MKLFPVLALTTFAYALPSAGPAYGSARVTRSEDDMERANRLVRDPNGGGLILDKRSLPIIADLSKRDDHDTKKRETNLETENSKMWGRDGSKSSSGAHHLHDRTSSQDSYGTGKRDKQLNGNYNWDKRSISEDLQERADESDNRDWRRGVFVHIRNMEARAETRDLEVEVAKIRAREAKPPARFEKDASTDAPNGSWRREEVARGAGPISRVVREVDERASLAFGNGAYGVYDAQEQTKRGNQERGTEDGGADVEGSASGTGDYVIWYRVSSSSKE
ncbi:hypothetical protein B0O99DRAFT_684443 [Bisporella sp. PMI_857]|nr:hypothetical protein B0O99DRAFT_684443 [Bisporella sp. PMI_857]